jgi:hypothetical protein
MLNRLKNTESTSDKFLRRHLLAHLQLGRVAWEFGDLPKVNEEYRLALDFGQKAVTANPRSFLARYNLAAALQELGRSELFNFRRTEEARRGKN